jgi:hypothetical protein
VDTETYRYSLFRLLSFLKVPRRKRRKRLVDNAIFFYCPTNISERLSGGKKARGVAGDFSDAPTSPTAHLLTTTRQWYTTSNFLASELFIRSCSISSPIIIAHLGLAFYVLLSRQVQRPSSCLGITPCSLPWILQLHGNCAFSPLTDYRSLKDTLRAVNSAFAEKTVAYPLHEDLERAIERCVDSRPHIDDNESQKIHEDLLLIYNCHVVGNIDKQTPFVAALRLMRPIIRGEQRLDTWWNLLIRPTIDSCGPRRDSIEEAREFLLRILVFDADEDSTGELAAMSSKFTRKLLDAYLTRTRIPSGDDVVSPEDEFIAQELEGILVAFGRKKPKVRIRLHRRQS